MFLLSQIVYYACSYDRTESFLLVYGQLETVLHHEFPSWTAAEQTDSSFKFAED